jgi:hypothetical protein
VGRGVHVVGVLLFVVAAWGAAVFRTVRVILVIIVVAAARAAAVVRTVGVGGIVCVRQREAAGGHPSGSEGWALALVALGRGHKAGVCAPAIQAVS